jgi:hypothetical protein
VGKWRDKAVFAITILLVFVIVMINTILISPLCSTGVNCQYYRDNITDWRPLVLVLLILIDILWFLMWLPEKKKVIVRG